MNIPSVSGSSLTNDSIIAQIDGFIEGLNKPELSPEPTQEAPVVNVTAVVPPKTNEDMQNIKPEYWQVNAQMWYDKHYD